MAQWFGEGYNYVGKITEINKRRTVQDNVSVAFSDELHGETSSQMVADANTYGADKLWVLLKAIPVDITADDDEEERESPASSGAGGAFVEELD